MSLFHSKADKDKFVDSPIILVILINFRISHLKYKPNDGTKGITEIRIFDPSLLLESRVNPGFLRTIRALYSWLPTLAYYRLKNVCVFETCSPGLFNYVYRAHLAT